MTARAVWVWSSPLTAALLEGTPVSMNNEAKCCDAVVRLLERNLDTQRWGSHYPDRIDSDKPQVDLCVVLGTKRYVLEHTRIEPFEEAIAAGIAVEKLTGCVKECLRAHGPLPGPAFYELKLPLDPRPDDTGGTAAKRRAKSERQGIERDIADWISVESISLHKRALRAGLCKPTQVGRQFAGSLLVHLVCTPTGPHSARTPGLFGAVRNAPDCQRALIDRIRTALEKKAPKLRTCRDRGARTVLVMEDDSPLLGYSSVRTGFEEASNGRYDLPDETYFVDTMIDTDWYLYPMNAAAELQFEVDSRSDPHCLFRPGDLDDLGGVRYDAGEGCEFCLGE